MPLVENQCFVTLHAHIPDLHDQTIRRAFRYIMQLFSGNQDVKASLFTPWWSLSVMIFQQPESVDWLSPSPSFLQLWPLLSFASEFLEVPEGRGDWTKVTSIPGLRASTMP